MPLDSEFIDNISSIDWRVLSILNSDYFLILNHTYEEVFMFSPNRKQNDVLEKFRIKAHLRSYIKDPIVLDEELLSEAVQKLKKLPYIDKDPSDNVAREFVLNAYRLGHFKQKDLTEDGYELISHSKYRGHQQLANKRIFSPHMVRNSYLLRAV
mgnify:FL=1